MQTTAPATQEYEALQEALSAFMRTLYWLESGRSADWRRLAEFEAGSAVAWTCRHCAEAEGPDGTLAELERTVGRTRRVTDDRCQHTELRRQALAFRSMLADGSSTLETVREQGAALMEALRRHANLATDLAYDAALDGDTGIGD